MIVEKVQDYARFSTTVPQLCDHAAADEAVELATRAAEGARSCCCHPAARATTPTRTSRSAANTSAALCS
jgi:hypothetical protein